MLPRLLRLLGKQPSVLVPQARKRDALLDEPTRDEVNRTCYVCFEFSGKPREECYMKKGGESCEYTVGHHGTKETGPTLKNAHCVGTAVSHAGRSPS